jgi:hypothetical protein
VLSGRALAERSPFRPSPSVDNPPRTNLSGPKPTEESETMFDDRFREDPYSVSRSAHLPFPELVEPRRKEKPWTILDSNDFEDLPSNGVTNTHDREIYVPLEYGGEGVSLHELSHVHWSPERLPRVRYPLIVLQAVEDARINLGLAAVGLKFELDREQLAQVKLLAARDIKHQQVAAGVIRAVASLGTGAEQGLYEELDGLPPAYVALARRCVDDVKRRLQRAALRADEPVAPFRVASKLARDLARTLRRAGLLDPKLKIEGVGCCHVISSSEQRGRRRGRWALLRGEARGGAGEGEEAKGVVPGKMSIAEPPLVVRQRALVSSRRLGWRLGPQGSHIVRPDRLAIDRAIFRRGVRRPGGTVLVDTSGSMCFSAEQVADLVTASGGAAVVAIYSGSKTVGELRIVARGNRRAANSEFVPFGAGNIVDVPALEWLSSQPEPRVWWSDAGVSGVHDQRSPEIVERCKRIVARARIRRVEDSEEAVRVLEGKRPKAD